MISQLKADDKKDLRLSRRRQRLVTYLCDKKGDQALNYDAIHEGIFRARPNRFIAHVEINGRIERCHVKNTGRCRELLVPGAKVYLHQPRALPASQRATKYDLTAVWKGEQLINMDSQAPNKVFAEYMRSGRYREDITLIKPETKYGGSRFDFYVETGKSKIFIEVKGVTLEENGVALFPDAPTERGVKHLNDLAQCIHDGYKAQVVFIIQMKGISHFKPNNRTHAAFGEALAKAAAEGVAVLALDCAVTPHSLTIGDPVPVEI